MNDSKSFLTSATLWGLVATVLSQLAKRYGLEVDDAGLTNDLVSLAAVGFAAWGRFRATQPLHVTN